MAVVTKRSSGIVVEISTSNRRRKGNIQVHPVIVDWVAENGKDDHSYLLYSQANIEKNQLSFRCHPDYEGMGYLRWYTVDEFNSSRPNNKSFMPHDVYPCRLISVVQEVDAAGNQVGETSALLHCSITNVAKPNILTEVWSMEYTSGASPLLRCYPASCLGPPLLVFSKSPNIVEHLGPERGNGQTEEFSSSDSELDNNEPTPLATGTTYGRSIDRRVVVVKPRKKMFDQGWAHDFLHTNWDYTRQSNKRQRNMSATNTI